MPSIPPWEEARQSQALENEGEWIYVPKGGTRFPRQIQNEVASPPTWAARVQRAAKQNEAQSIPRPTAWWCPYCETPHANPKAMACRMCKAPNPHLVKPKIAHKPWVRLEQPVPDTPLQHVAKDPPKLPPQLRHFLAPEDRNAAKTEEADANVQEEDDSISIPENKFETELKDLYAMRYRRVAMGQTKSAGEADAIVKEKVNA